MYYAVYTVTLVLSTWLTFVRSRARTLGRHRKPNDVVTEHKKRATTVWIGLLVSIVGCERFEYTLRPLEACLVCRT